MGDPLSLRTSSCFSGFGRGVCLNSQITVEMQTAKVSRQILVAATGMSSRNEISHPFLELCGVRPGNEGDTTGSGLFAPQMSPKLVRRLLVPEDNQVWCGGTKVGELQLVGGECTMRLE